MVLLLLCGHVEYNFLSSVHEQACKHLLTVLGCAQHTGSFFFVYSSCCHTLVLRGKFGHLRRVEPQIVVAQGAGAVSAGKVE